MKPNSSGKWRSFAALLTLPAAALTLLAQQTNSLIISGLQGQATVIQAQGSNYVEVNGLARVIKGSISFDGNQIVLTLPGSGAGTPGHAQVQAPAEAEPQTPASPAGFSKAFFGAGTEAMALVREWHTALKTAIEHGIPINDQWLGPYYAQSRESVRLASAAISTDSDKSAYPFLVHEFNNMKSLSDEYVRITKNMDYIAPNSLQNDALNQRFVACAHSLSSMASTNQFVDDGSCQ